LTGSDAIAESDVAETWLILESGRGEPAWNMALDEALLQSCAQLSTPILRLYGWTEPAATFGYFQKYADVPAWTDLRPLIRRPTGGGLVPHAADWTYSLSFPPQHWWYDLKAAQSYEMLHQWISESFSSLRVQTELAPEARKDIPGQCFVGAERFDLLHAGQKIAGAAQRRLKTGLLIQGSIQRQPKAIERETWESQFLKTAAAKWSVEWKPIPNLSEIELLADELSASKYKSAAYNERR